MFRRRFAIEVNSRSPWVWRVLLSVLPLALGCGPAAETTIHGHWVGRADQLSSAWTPADATAMSQVSSPSQSTDGETQAVGGPFELSLDFQPNGQFTCGLHSSSRKFPQIAGSWRATQATGNRWQVELTNDADRRTLRLQLVFTESDQFTATQIDGDDRVGRILFRRQADGATTVTE